MCAFVIKLVSVSILSEVNTVQARKSFCTITSNLGDIRLINRFAVPRARDLNLTLRACTEKRAGGPIKSLNKQKIQKIQIRQRKR